MSTRALKLTADDARAIVIDPRIHREIAATYNVCTSVISSIKRGHIWKLATGGAVDIRGKGYWRKVAHTKSARVTEKDVIAIRADTRDSREVAQQFAISRHQIYRIRSGKSWAHVKDIR